MKAVISADIIGYTKLEAQRAEDVLSGTYNSKTTKPKMIYSKVLDKTFKSASEASRYVNKYTNYCYNCMSGAVANKYGFESI